MATADSNPTDFAPADEYDYNVGNNNGHSNSYQDEPTALLESLANFSNDAAPGVSHDQFASLLRAAAATAGGEDVAQKTPDQGFFRRSFPPEPRPATATGLKRTRNEQNEDQRTYGIITTPGSKRRRLQTEEDEEARAREREIWGDEEDEDDEDGSTSIDYRQTPIATADARAAGVHSAAALFRRPSQASKKYTRPPMATVFGGLELDGEQFVRMQAAAKTFMLDPNHPERSDSVGGRGRGDTDMTKLKLFACVKQFLEEEGWGDRCFGPDAPGAEFRKLKWPQMKTKIISQVTPLMRRMVTNERQRIYAAETRKEKRQGVPKTGGTKRPHAKKTSATSAPGTPSAASPASDLDVDLNDQYHYNIDPSFSAIEGVDFHVNIMQDGRRLKPKFTLNPSSCPGFASLVQHILASLDSGGGQRLSSVKVLGPNGLSDVGDEDSWRGVIASIKEHEWMDGEVKCVVEIEKA